MLHAQTRGKSSITAFNWSGEKYSTVDSASTDSNIKNFGYFCPLPASSNVLNRPQL